MMRFRQINFTALVVGASCLAFAVNVLWRGQIWNILLGNERYGVGAFMLIASVYFLFLSLKGPRSHQ